MKVIRDKDALVDRRNHVTILIQDLHGDNVHPGGPGGRRGNVQNAREYPNCQYMTRRLSRTSSGHI
jgi:hypothetical protein